MNILALRRSVRAFSVNTGATISSVVGGLVLVLTAVALSSCGNAEQTPTEDVPAAAAPQPTQSAPPPATPPPGASAPQPTMPLPAPPKPEPPKPAAKPRPSAPPPTTSSSAPSAPAPAGLPVFPWPPPRYSAFSAVARQWVAPDPYPTLGSAASRLERAFEVAGYGEWSYYWIPGGFALVSRIEQIRSDATPVAPPARWAIETPDVREGFIDHIRALFNSPPGFYRVIVFTVADQDFAAGERPPTSEEARNWISSGSLRLPEALGTLPYSERHSTFALIYEFERRPDRSEARVRVPSDSPGRVHLEKAGLWQALARR